MDGAPAVFVEEGKDKGQIRLDLAFIYLEIVNF
jgi:hypothetical protein